jgi:hypothetical protein
MNGCEGHPKLLPIAFVSTLSEVGVGRVTSLVLAQFEACSRVYLVNAQCYLGI